MMGKRVEYVAFCVVVLLVVGWLLRLEDVDVREVLDVLLDLEQSAFLLPTPTQ